LRKYFGESFQEKTLRFQIGVHFQTWPLYLLILLNAILVYSWYELRKTGSASFHAEEFHSILFILLGFSLLLQQVRSKNSQFLIFSQIVAIAVSLLCLLNFVFSPQSFNILLSAASVAILCLRSSGSWRNSVCLTIASLLGLSGLFITFSQYSNQTKLYFIEPISHDANVALIFGYSLILLSVSIAGATLDHGPLSFLKGDTTGSKLGRRLVLTVAIVPATIEVLFRMGMTNHIYNESIKSALVSIIAMSVLVFAVLYTLRFLHLEELTRLRSETKYRRLKKKYQSLIETAPDPILYIDYSGNISLINNEGLKYFGYSAEEVLGKSPFFLVAADQKEKLMRFYRNFRQFPGRTTIGVNDEFFVQKRDGTIAPVEISVSPCSENEGISIICIVRDLSFQKGILQKLKNSEKMLNLALENLPIGIWFTDESGNIVYANKACYSLWGTKPGFLENNIQVLKGRLKSGQEVMLHGGALRNCIRSNESILNQVVDIKRIDGSKRTILNSVVPIMDDEGHRHGAISVNEDVSVEYQRKERAEITQRLAYRLNGFFDDTFAARQLAECAVPLFADWCVVSYREGDTFQAAAIVHKDPNKNKLLEEVVAGNHDFRFKLDEMIHSLHSNTPLLVGEIDRTRYAGLNLGEDYLEKLHRLGTTSYIMAPISHKDSSIGVVFFGVLEESRSYVEEDLRFAEDLCKLFGLSVANSRLFEQTQKAIQAREEILAIVAHDIRGPISTMLLAAEMMERSQRAKNLDSQGVCVIEKYAKLSRLAGNRGLKLIQDLLDCGKIESGTFSINKQKCLVNELLQVIPDLFRIEIDAKNLSLITNFSITHGELYCDRDRLVQALSNILGNSVKFTPAGGKIEVTASLTEGNLLLAIRDSGPGITKENLQNIFDRFWQVKDTASLGSGLGLSIAKGIVQAHGGRIWAESEIGRGCQISICIPGMVLESNVKQLALPEHVHVS
jgi:PAS domain S-box-containing protein